MLKTKIKKIEIQIILILILMFITIINMSPISFAKYVFDYTAVVAEVKIEKTQTEIE